MFPLILNPGKLDFSATLFPTLMLFFYDKSIQFIVHYEKVGDGLCLVNQGESIMSCPKNNNSSRNCVYHFITQGSLMDYNLNPNPLKSAVLFTGLINIIHHFVVCQVMHYN